MAERTCAGCTTTITPHPRERNPKVWCTDACRFRWKRANDPTILDRQRVRRGVRPARWREAERKLAKAAKGTHGGRTVLASGPCGRCGTQYTVATPPTTSQTRHNVCSQGCREANKRDRRRARKRAAFVSTVNRQAIFRRDRWTCRICGRHLKRNAVVPHPLAPTIDHIVPLAKGGTHEPANVQAAHFLCNSRKGDRATEDQLRLIG